MAYRDMPGRRAPATEPDWLTLGQAAKYLGVAQSTIRKWSDQGRVPAFYTPGGHRRFRRADLDAFVGSSRAGHRSSAPVVLVVDGDPRHRELIRASLQGAGYSVREADGVAAALPAIEDRAPELVLLEVVMPGWRPPPVALHLVMPPGGPRPARVEALAEFLTRRLARHQAGTAV